MPRKQPQQSPSKTEQTPPSSGGRSSPTQWRPVRRDDALPGWKKPENDPRSPRYERKP